MKITILIILISLTTSLLSGQDSTKTNYTKLEGYKQWTKYRTALRFGIGLQKSFFLEVGVSEHKYFYNELGFASSAYYSSLEFTPSFSTSNKSVYGLKIGYEINARVVALGIETKYQTDFNAKEIIITPKIGFGFIGVINIFYGYNILITKSLISKTGQHQFSVACNLNRKFLKNNKGSKN